MLNEQFVDAVHGTTIQRISKDNSSWRRHEYSRRPAFNANSSRIIMRSSGGYWHLYRIKGKRVVYDHALPSPMTEPNWHPTDSNRYRYFDDDGEGMNIREYNIATRRSRVIANFKNRLPWRNAGRVWTRWEGRPSDDGNIWCLMAETSDFKALGLFSYDLAKDRVIATLDLDGEPDHVATSVNGRYCVPSSDDFGGGTRAYSLDFSRFRQLHGGSEHSDVALDANGRDVLVLADYSSGQIRMVDMASGRSTPLLPLYNPRGSTFSVHISGLATASPGHVVVSTYNSHLDYGSIEADYGDMWGHDRLAIVELKANPKIYNVAYLRNGRGDYWSEPQATVNRDLSRILYASTWGSNSDNDSRTYMVTMPMSAEDLSVAKRRFSQSLARLRILTQKMKSDSFRNSKSRNWLLARIRLLNLATTKSRWTLAATHLRSLRQRLDGCGSRPDRNDLVIHCVKQRNLRRLYVQVAVSFSRLRSL